MRRLILCIVLAAGPAAAAWADEVRTIAPEALAVRLESGDPALLVVDVRSAAEYDEGHLPGAVNIPHDAIGGRMAEFGAPGERDIVVYCRSGRRSELALAALQEAGFSRLFHLEGDYLRWSEEDRPMMRAPAQP